MLRKLDQIEEQAKLTLDEYPKGLTKERLRRILALVGYIRTEATRSPLLEEIASNDAGVPGRKGHLRGV